MLKNPIWKGGNSIRLIFMCVQYKLKMNKMFESLLTEETGPNNVVMFNGH